MKDGSLRLCVDLRKQNAMRVGDSFSLPSIEEFLLKVWSAKVFSTLDLKQGYYQIEVDAASLPKTAFVIADALYEFNRLPFGAKNAP